MKKPKHRNAIVAAHKNITKLRTDACENKNETANEIFTQSFETIEKHSKLGFYRLEYLRIAAKSHRNCLSKIQNYRKIVDNFQGLRSYLQATAQLEI